MTSAHPPDDSLQRARSCAAQLVHDVGKHVSRAARNLDRGAFPRALVEMMIADIFGEEGRRSPAEELERLGAELAAIREEPRLELCGELFARIEDMKEQILRGEPSSIRAAAELAIRIDDELRALARGLASDRNHEDET
jgi:hypothetical protein